MRQVSRRLETFLLSGEMAFLPDLRRIAPAATTDASHRIDAPPDEQSEFEQSLLVDALEARSWSKEFTLEGESIRLQKKLMLRQKCATQHSKNL